MFLDDLIARVLGDVPALTPLRASRFEPAPDIVEETTELFAPPTPATRDTVIQAATPARVVASAQAIDADAGVTHPQSAPPASFAATRVSVAKHDAPPTRAEPAASPVRPAPEGTRERRPPVPAAPPRNVDSAREVVTPTPPATNVRKVIERHAETSVIERRLQSLVHQHTVERIDDVRPAAAPRPRPPESPAVAPRAPAPPHARRTVRPALKAAAVAPPSLERTLPPPAIPAVHVTIGRVEVRASGPRVTQAPGTSRERKPDLEAYLRRRERT